MAYDYSPACWSWEPPTDAFRERMQAHWGPVFGKNGILPSFMMREWQAERCAMCGFLGKLVEDHDHETGLVRGFLCSRCNTAEGMNPGNEYRAWREYRERSPAMICGVRERYWNEWTKQFAEPAEPPWSDADRWKRSPMHAAGL